MKKVPGHWVDPLTPAQKGLLWKACKPNQVQSWLSVVLLDFFDIVIILTGKQQRAVSL